MSFLTPAKKPIPPGAMAQPIRSRQIQRPNLIRAMRENDERRHARSSAAAAVSATVSVSASAQPSLSSSRRTQCPNKACPKPNVVDGICRSCGRVVDDSNIVSEVQFGETSSGAAMVQGSFIGPDQGGVRSLGPNFRRVGGSEDREKSIRDAKMLIVGFAQQLNLSESLVNSAVQAFKLASNANFIQGRSLPGVAAVCLYVACRNEPPCKIMLLDLADLVRINVFKLGRTFKAFNKAIPICNGGFDPVYPEDLIYRFATKLEFQNMTSKVAEDAVRLVRRMSRDWMVMGRRPSGICGACLLMAARMNNFRRTVREVVYIVKVTNHTIQNRLEEFKVTESSKMTVEDFLSQDLLESSHDPPSFYKKSAEYQARMYDRTRKRKRPVEYDAAAEREAEAARLAAQPLSQAPVQKLPVDPSLMAPMPPTTQQTVDADGFVVPAVPVAASSNPRADSTPTAGTAATAPDDNSIANAATSILSDPESEAALSHLARNFGDKTTTSQNSPGANDSTPATASQPAKAHTKMPVDQEWEADELDLEEQISEIFNDPQTIEHAEAFESAQKRAERHSQWALAQQPHRQVSMAAEVGEDEFANDPEVANCLLSEEEARNKERLWCNNNKDWLRAQQEKLFRAKMAAERPKQTRRRKKRRRMGEGQVEPADSAADAAVSVMKERAISKRINYDAIRSLFDIDTGGGEEEEEEEDAQEEEEVEEEEEMDAEEEEGEEEDYQGEQSGEEYY
ncbi:hypothetical protein TD95_000177 [Thielaviopsis punctulata]|uniref:Cyclin-like domain-containing protein n=1 Tax=Thielaviopsis punctulata TaxID=72032 RepID=A0A0F4ZCN5_9PEZI|nr:hypothetical protein TD95_000177 [Thielaviopsis punctulata]